MKIVTPSNMEAAESVLVVIWVAVGGRGTLRGAILGALTVNLMYNYLTSEHDYGFISWNPAYWQIFLGIAFVLVVLYLPNGLIEVVDRAKAKFANGLIEVVERAKTKFGAYFNNSEKG